MRKLFGLESKERKQARAAGINPDAIKTLTGHTSEVQALTVLQDGRLASGSWDSTIKIWNLKTWTCELTLTGHTGIVNALIVLSDGRLASCSPDGSIKVWNVRTGACEATLTGHTGAVMCLVALPNGRFASGSVDKTIKVWNVRTGTCEATFTGHTETVMGFAILSDGRLASYEGHDKSIKLWNVSTGTCESTLEQTDWADALLALPDDRLAIVHYDAIKIWNMRTSACEATITEDNMGRAILALPDGRLAISSGDYPHYSIKIFNVRTGSCEATLKTKPNTVKVLTLLQNGYLASGLDDHSIKIWDLGLGPVLVQKTTTEPRVVEELKKGEDGSAAQKAVPPQKAAKPKVNPALVLPTSSPEKADSPAASVVVSNHEPSHPTSTNIQNSVALTLSKPALEALIQEQQAFEARSPASLETLEQELVMLQQRLAQSNITTTLFSTNDTAMLRARVAQDRHDEALLIERKTIKMQPELETYYQAIQTHFSALMVASLGVASGYIDVNHSTAAQAVDWIGKALGFAFPTHHVDAIATVVSAGVNFLDGKYREKFLEKIKIFGTTITEAEILGEQVARLLVRAHFYAEIPLSLEKAEKDAQALIQVIVKADPPLVRNETSAEVLVKAIMGNQNICTELLPPQSIQSLLPPAPLKPPKPKRILTPPVTPVTPISPVVNTPSSNSSTVEELMHRLAESEQVLEEERAERKRLEEKQQAHDEILGKLQAQMQNAALKSDVASKKELAATQAIVAKLDGSNKSEGGQMLMSREEHAENTEAAVSEKEKSEKRLAYMELHVGSVTEETMRLQAENEQNKLKLAEFEQLLVSAKLLPQKGVFVNTSTSPNMTANEGGASLKKTTPSEEEALKQIKSTLFSK